MGDHAFFVFHAFWECNFEIRCQKARFEAKKVFILRVLFLTKHQNNKLQLGKALFGVLMHCQMGTKSGQVGSSSCCE